MNPSNPAAMQGWVKSIDPKSGRAFYANHITRKTQWDEPDGWIEQSSPPLLPPSMEDEEDDGSEQEPLPSNWEVMHDPTTGKPFYVDHERKITQWVRPKVEKTPTRPISYAPASTTTSRTTTSSAAMARILQASNSNSSSTPTAAATKNYSNQASRSYSHADVDFSDSMPALDFSVKKVADKYRLECPHCDALFTLSKRRHHCRLCGDVFCDPCSSHRVSLPLAGAEFEKPVRICDFCNKDVEQGNFFSMRRYLTPLQLFDPENNAEDEDGVATPANVNAALGALTQDLDQMVQNAEGFEERVTIPPKILVSTIVKHLSGRSNTADRAVRALASLLSMGSMVGKNDFAHAVYLYGRRQTLDRILTILERSGSDRKTLFVQEKAAQTLFYLTDSQIMSTLAAKHGELSRTSKDEEEEEALGDVDALDIQRTLRNMLDHSSMSKNPNLQRWSAATVRNLVMEDQRRATLAINDVAARVASGEPPSSLEYESFLDSLVATGGVMILCSLVGADDSDTRAHATGALGAILTATRAIDGAMSALAEMTGGSSGRSNKKDGDIVRAITAGGGCGSSVSQLLLSADNVVATMGCEFMGSLVMPLLTDPLGTGTLPSAYDCRNDQEVLGACREAALEIASGSCLPAMLSLVKESGRMTRPIKLRKIAMETLAATVIAIGEMGKAWAGGKYEEGMDMNGAPGTLTRALAMLNEEQVIDVALEVLGSSSVQSLGSARDTPEVRMREAAGIILGSLTACSAEAIMELHSRDSLSNLIMTSSDPSMTAVSTIRGDAAPRCLGMLEAASSILMFAWQHPSGASSELLDRLIEALDAGAITHLFRVLTSQMDWDSRDKSAGGMKARSAACGILCCLFGLALGDDTTIGMRRLMEACDADQANRRKNTKGPRNIFEAVLTVMQTALGQAHKAVVGRTTRSPQYQAALLDIVEASLLSTGSMCGSSIAPGGAEGTMITGDKFLVMRADDYDPRRKEVCKVACDVVFRHLPTMLVGAFGEGTVMASLRLALAIAQNGSQEQHTKLASSGLLVPVSDLLRSALTQGDLYKFSASLALVRFCGPYVAAGSAGGVESVREAIRIATNVLTLPVSPDASVEQIKNQEALKSECINALESLSKNAALWSTISTDALPSIVSYLHSCCDPSTNGLSSPQSRCAALRAVLEIVQVPSHAVSAAEAGLAEPLGRTLKTINALRANQQDADDNMEMLAMEVLHVLVKNRDARRHCRLLQSDTLRSVCAAVGYSANMESDSRADIASIGLDILHFVLSDVEALGETPQVLQSPEALAYLDCVSAEPRFIRALCATLLLKTGMKIQGDVEDMPFDVPELFGPPLVLVKQPCGGQQNTHDASAALLFAVSTFACAIESHGSESFWKSALLEDLRHIEERTECVRSASTFCSIFLKLLSEDYKALAPAKGKSHDFESLARPLVRYRLLEALKGSLEELTKESISGHHEIDEYMLALLADCDIPYICLSVWRDPALLEVSYELIKMMVEADPEEVLHLFVERKESMISLFDLLNLDSSAVSDGNITSMRRFLASTLEKLAQNGMLTEAVEKFEIRSSAIAALASASLIDDERDSAEEEELTSTGLASGLMQCLVELCTGTDKTGESKVIQLSPIEAEAIARTVGKKICQMVIARFLERAKLQHYEIDDDENIMDAPDVGLLCALAQHEGALHILKSLGGFHALAQVASEGELSAMAALRKGCENDPILLLEADTYVSIISLFSKDKEDAHWRAETSKREQVEATAFALLAQLGSGSAKGRRALVSAPDFRDSFDRALEVVASIAPPSPPTEDDSAEMPVDRGESCDIGEDDEETKPVVAAEEQATTTVSTEGTESFDLIVSAYSYLSSMISVPSIRDALLENAGFIEASSAVIVDGKMPDLQLESVFAIAKFAPYSSVDGTLSSNRVGDLLLSALATEQEANLHVHAAKGIQFVFDSLAKSKQESVMKTVATLYTKVLKRQAISRGSPKANESANRGELAYHLTTILMLARGKDTVEQCFDAQLLLTLVNTVQWRFDPKTVIAQEDVCFWDGSTTQCLQLLSQALSREDTKLAKAGIKTRSLKESVFMVARPGKAARKAIDFKSALTVATKHGEAAAKLAAQRIFELLYADN